MTWPLPALLAWGAAWLGYAGLRSLGLAAFAAAGIAAAFGLAFAVRATTPWRRVFVALGFPLSWLAGGFGAGAAGTTSVSAWPAWAWLVPLALLWLAYPKKAWRDAPLFPTPAGALRGLADVAPLPSGAHVLDAGCGLGAGLVELRRAYPTARLVGIEWSRPLRLLCAWRCRDAEVVQGDIWQAPWSGYDLVYLFQRPESLPRAIAKANREMRRGAWLASLEFEAAECRATHRLDGASGRPVWLYRVPVAVPAAQLPAETP